MRVSTVSPLVAEIRDAFEAAAEPEIAPDMARYMKSVSSFLGLKTPQRRAAITPILKQAGRLTTTELLGLVDELYAQPEREFKYAACDVLARFNKRVPSDWIDSHVRRWLLTEPWWDTVDSLVSAVIAPVTARNPSLEPVMASWLASDEMWLQRAAIGHQRGRKQATDVALQLRYCAAVASDTRFFIAKAVGWALRDLSAIDLAATKQFVADYPLLPKVAAREALRGIERAELRSSHGKM